MKIRTLALALACFGGLTQQCIWAQVTQPVTQQADYIVAVVNSEPIVNSELSLEVMRIRQQLVAQKQPMPGDEELRKGVLERMIGDKSQLQLARENGMRIDVVEVDQAEQNVARQNQMDVAELRRRLAKDGITPATFRSQLRDQLLLSRLHEREVAAKIRITDAEVERFLQDQKASNSDPFAQEINLAQIFVAVPEKATDEQVAYFALQAKNVLARVRSGEDFSKVVKEVSTAEKTNGGALGLRKADRYPTSFVLATQQLAIGGVSDIVRSPAGFHILKVLEKVAPAAAAQSVPETRARHILLRVSPTLTQPAAMAKLAEVRQSILDGKSDFQTVAKELSQDGSAPQGGDLGWARPGMFVPEFEDVMGRLKVGEISPPFISRFGVHIIQLAERRRVDFDVAELRESARTKMREARYDEAFANWARDVRDRAFVEYREPPQ
jgi:peptidyl-prolyl cis-trans isomerase SurA